MKDVLKIINRIVFCCAVIYFIAGIYGGERNMGNYSLWTIILTVGFYLLSMYIQKLGIFMVSHILLAGLCVLIEKLLVGREEILVIIVGVMLLSVMVRILPDAGWFEEPGYFHLAVMAVGFLGHSYLGQCEGAISCAMVSFVVIFLLKIIYGNQKEVEEFIQNRSSSTQIDEYKFKQLNMRLTLLYTCVLAGVLGLVGFIRAEGISNWLLNGVKQILQFIFGNIQKLSEETENDMINETGTVLQQYVTDTDVAQTSWVAQLLDVMIEVCVVILLVAFVIFAVVCVGRIIYFQFYRKQNGHQDKADYVEPLLMREKGGRKRRPDISMMFEHNPSGRVRKYYRKLMRKYSSDEFEYMTPKEQIAVIADKRKLSGEDQERLLVIYEKVRYTNELPSKEEEKWMKDMINSMEQ